MPLVALVDELMRACDQFQAVHVVELGGHLVTKQPAGATRTHGPCFDLLWVAPHQVAESALMRDLLGASDHTNLVKRTNLWREAAMHAKDFTINKGGEGKEIEHLCRGFPDGGVAIFLMTFFIEPVDLGDLSRLVIATDEGDAIGVAREKGQIGGQGV